MQGNAKLFKGFRLRMGSEGSALFILPNSLLFEFLGSFITFVTFEVGGGGLSLLNSSHLSA